MRTRSRLLVAFAISMVALSASAQNNRSFVATFGNDANDCTANNECRSFSRALSVTNAGGEVIAVNSGGFGPFIAAKSVTVAAAPGVRASITSSSSDSVDVLAGSTDKVTLSGLMIFNTGAFYGIGAGGFGSLTIEDCRISGGIFALSITGGNTSFLTMTDTVVRNATLYGAVISNHAALIRCRFEGNGNAGLYITEGGTTDGVVSAVDLVAVNNAYGVYATCATPSHNVVFNLDRGLISSNVDNGVYANASAGTTTVRVTNSSVTQNGIYGFIQSGTSTFYSLVNNMVAGNGGDTNGLIQTLTAK